MGFRKSLTLSEKQKEVIRAVKFTIFSVSAGIIEMAVFALLEFATDWSYWPCYLIALIASVIWNFTLNRQFTFKSANNVPIAMLKVAGFYLVFTPLSTIAGNYLAETVGLNDFLVTAINMVCNFVLEYLFDRFVVFGNSIDTQKTKKADN
ncbi:MAG: GtrA family protein [Treponemataceae bacterium]|nr:GtrA family protein [Treponemataceae bacterium]